MLNSDVFDTSVWPCATPDLFWALTDVVDDIGELHSVDEDTIVYDINTAQLPAGRVGLQTFSALRRLRMSFIDWPEALVGKLETATLALGSKPLERLTIEEDSDIEFSMFQGTAILPLFVVDEPLQVVLQTKFLSDMDRLNVPQRAVKADGLLCRVKSQTTPFFVATSKSALLTWDGVQSRVKSHIVESFVVPRPKAMYGFTAGEPHDLRQVREVREVRDDDRTEAQDLAVMCPDSTFEDLHRALATDDSWQLPSP